MDELEKKNYKKRFWLNNVFLSFLLCTLIVAIKIYNKIHVLKSINRRESPKSNNKHF